MDQRAKYNSYKTIKLLEENTGEKLHDVGFGNDILDTKSTGNKRKNRRSEHH